MKSIIPGNRYSEKRIYSDNTLESLEAELKRIVGAQAANMRGNLRYVAYVNLLRRNISKAV